MNLPPAKLIAPEAMATTGDATADSTNTTAAATGSATLFAKAAPIKTGLQDIFGAGAGSANELLSPGAGICAERGWPDTR